MSSRRASDWPEVPLGELTDPSTPITYGVVKPGPEGEPGTAVRFIRSGDLNGGRIDASGLRTITPEVSAQYRRTLLSGNEVLMSLVGNPGEVALAHPDLAGSNIARQVALIRTGDSLTPQFTRYFFMSPHGRNRLLAKEHGSVQRVINLKDLKQVQITLPPIDEQRRIAAVLGALDDKIELNRKMNRTLEEMAQAIFKSWFPGDVLEVAVPDGWVRTTLGEWCDSLGGEVQTGPFGSQLHASDYVPVGVPSVMPKNLKEDRVSTEDIARIAEEDAQRLSKHRVAVGDIIYSRRGDVERRALVTERERGWLCGTGCLRVRLRGQEVDNHFLYRYLGLEEVRAWIVRHAQGDDDGAHQEAPPQ